MLPWYWHRYTNILLHQITIMFCTSINSTWTLLSSVRVSFNILDTPVRWILYFVYTLITLDIVILCTCITATHMLLHWTPIISCSCTINTLATITACSWTLLFHVLYHCYTVIRVLALHGYSRTWVTVIKCGYLLYWTLLLHILVDLLHGSCLHRYYCFIHIYCYIDSPACMRWLSLYSCYIEHCSCHMDYCYMIRPVFALHDYFPY